MREFTRRRAYAASRNPDNILRQLHLLRLYGLCALLLTLAPVREARSQDASPQAEQNVLLWPQKPEKPVSTSPFSAPWDPDFAQQPQAAPAAAPAVPAEAEPLPAVIPAKGSFLLLDRPDAHRIWEPAALPAAAPQVPSTAPSREFLDFVKILKPFAYSQERFVQARTALEEGRAPVEGLPVGLVEREAVAVSTSSNLRPPPPELEMPSQQMSLSVTGRKIIGVQFSEKRYLYDQSATGRPTSTNLFDIQQQLQLRMQGKVGPKISINIDYDDTRTDNQQDISIVYQGNPNEPIQNVSFGDIDLSLPPTEFVSYNKQLFGIRADVKYRGLKASVIGSRTKGTTKFREFIGNTQFVSNDLLDTSYVRHQYYDLAFGTVVARLPIRSGSEQIWLSQMNVGSPNVNQSSFTVDDLGQAVATLSSDKWTRLSPGTDYTIDYINAILTFRTPVQPQWAVAVDYLDASGRALSVQTSTSASGGTGLRKLIKAPSDVALRPDLASCDTCSLELGYKRELKTVYNLGQPQIVRDNGQGNFVLKVFNAQRQEIGSTLNPVQKYPDTINVDFENGIFRLLQPFAVVGDSSTQDPDIYSPTPISKRLLHVEFYYRLRTFFLDPAIVAQSEIVLVDNVKLNRNVDYFIDYQSGFITFFNPDRVGTNSKVDISYEVSPLGGVSDVSLLGGRVSYDFTKNISLGSTLLYQAGVKSQITPSVTELASSLLVYDFDLKLKDIQLLPKLKASFAGEFAQSRQNPNLNDFAIVDNMEGINQETPAAVTPANTPLWQIASNPGGVPVDPSILGWSNENINTIAINPRSAAASNATQPVLDLTYDFSAPDAAACTTKEASIVFPFSVAGVDLSQKSVLEVVMLGDDSSNLLNFRLGGIDENADGSGTLRTEDTAGDGILHPGADIGFLYQPPGCAHSARYGANNGVLDSVDINKNNRLDQDDGFGGNFGYLCAGGSGSLCTSSSSDQLFSLNSGTHTAIDFGSGASGSNAGWQTFYIPLNISTANIANWQAIKDIRISVKSAGGSATKTSGVIKFAHISVIGTTWQKGAAGDPATGQTQLISESVSATPVNSVDNPTYIPIYNGSGDAQSVFNDLYGSVASLQKQSGSQNISEQSLQIDFSSMTLSSVAGSTTTVFTKRVFTTAIDVSQHKQLNFLLYANADPSNINTTDHKFFLRLGNDANFWEVQVPLSGTTWQKISINQFSSSNNGVMDSWSATQPGVVVLSSGAPSLQQVGEIVAGVYKTAGPANTKGRLWLDEIYLGQPVVRVGNAYSAAADFDLKDWGTFGFKERSVDRNFQTPTSVVSNQDNRLDSVYLNIKRLSYFPMSFNLKRTITDTPNTALTGNLSNLVNALAAGKVTNWNGSAQGNFALGAWPRLSLSSTRNRTEYSLLTRTDDAVAYNGTLQYGIPLNRGYIPKTLDLNYSYATTSVEFSSLEARQIPGNINSNDLSQTFGIKLTFAPWQGSSFNPHYSLAKVSERTDDDTGPTELKFSYPKSLNQSMGFTSNFRLLSWLNPQVNYQIDTIENSILTVSTYVVNTSTYVFNPGEIKTVNRSANGSINLPLTVGEIFPHARLLHSLNIVSGYQIQDGDVYNQVERGYNAAASFWVRTPLKPSNAAAQLANQTLRDTVNSTQRWSPLEAFNLKGRLVALKTLSLSNNFVYSVQRSNTTGTLSKTIATTLPDLVATLGQIEKLVAMERWLNNTQTNLRLSAHRTENVGASIITDLNVGSDLRSIILKRFDSLLSYNFRTSKTRDLLVDANTQDTQHQDATAQTNFSIRKFYLTPKIDYTHDETTLGTGVQTQNITILTPSLLVRTDVALPRGLMLPGAKKAILFSNRIIWTTTLSWADRRSPVTQADNSDLFSLTTSGDYEIAKNLRMTMNGAASRLWNRYLKQEDFLSYQFGTTMTFQF